MSDDPRKKKLDGKRISKQPWEQSYQRRKKARLQKQVTTHADVAKEDAGNQPVNARRPAVHSALKQKLTKQTKTGVGYFQDGAGD